MSKTIYRLTKDYSYPYFLSHENEGRSLLLPGCKSHIAEWDPPQVYQKGTGSLGDFCHFDEGYLIAAPRALTLLKALFDGVSEMLPIYYENVEYKLVNVLRCVDALDEKKCVEHPTLGRFDYIKLAFFAEIVPLFGLFKVSPYKGTKIFVCVNDELGDEVNFKFVCTQHAITGILFEEVWREAE